MTNRSYKVVEGETTVEVDTVSAADVEALHGLLDCDGRPPQAGHPVPPLWHWLAFTPRTAQRDLGADGHPLRGGIMPEVGLRSRMFAGASVTLLGPLIVGEPATRRSKVVATTEKLGRSGPLVFVTLQHLLGHGDATSVVEEQRLVFREGTLKSGSVPRPQTSAEPAPPAEWTGTLRVDERLLFRFSALTYNAHRIHYDRDYAMTVEGYPGLVVQGPLQAIALAELYRRKSPTSVMRTFQFKSIAPAYDGGPLDLRGTPRSDGRVFLEAYSHDGRKTMEAMTST